MNTLKKQPPVTGDGRRGDRPGRSAGRHRLCGAVDINGGAIQKQSIGGGKLKHKTLTGYQINTTSSASSPPPSAPRTPTGRSSTTRPAASNAKLARASDAGITATEAGGAVAVDLPGQRQRLRQRRRPQQRRHDVPSAGYAQTNTAPTNANAIEVHTRDKNGANEDADFHLIVVCP